MIELQPGRPRPARPRGLAVLLVALALLALLAPALAGVNAAGRVGLLLVLAGTLEAYDGFRRRVAADQRAAWESGAVTLLMGGLVLQAGALVGRALVLLLAGWFLFDAGRYAFKGLTGRQAGRPRDWLLPALGNLAVGLGLLAVRGRGVLWTGAVAACLRILGTAWNVLHVPVRTAEDSGDTVLEDLGLQGSPELVAVAERLELAERARGAVDRAWIWGFTFTLLAIHVGRMGLDRSFLGLFSPTLAVLGDLFIALVVAFGVVVPARLAWRRASRRLERRAWGYGLSAPAGRAGRLSRAVVRAWLEGRLRFAVRMRQARYSPVTALRRGLQIGLPAAAVIAATVPVWGMSWYFDTENWAAGVWNSWAESRTDAWREAMVRAVQAGQPVGRGAAAFAVAPEGLPAEGDFAFLVIGDTGEGDASQHVLRDVLLEAARPEEVRFVVLSSDVVYPTGAMRDYEAKFWLPFKGLRQPVYAIPGNHDWYDALEGFAATFLEPGAARLALRARVEADQHLTSTTEAHVESLIATAQRLAREYGVEVGRQQAPFFQVQTAGFALIAVDTGVVKGVDPLQLRWLEEALEASRGKLVMAVLGHPLYAGGVDQSEGVEGFAALHALLRRHGVAIAMGGDTHDLEHYVETWDAPGGPRVMRHWVNGGGGAYLSFGTALAWPEQPATPEWAYYPGRRAVFDKIEGSTPAWKWPAWWWTKRLGAWPFTPEWLSAAFDSNQAPFFQSFVEVRVEPSARRVRLLPWGVHGRLRWSDFDASPGARPAGVAPDAPVEWLVPWQAASASR